MALLAGDRLEDRSVAAFFAAVILCQAVNAEAARTQGQPLLQQDLQRRSLDFQAAN